MGNAIFRQTDSGMVRVRNANKSAVSADAMPTNGLIAKWNFNNSNGDDSFANWNLVSYGTASYVDGKIGKCASFNGVDQSLGRYFYPELTSVFAPNWIFWFKTTDTGGTLIYNRYYSINYTPHYFRIRVLDDGKLQSVLDANFSEVETRTLTTLNNYNDGEWHLVSCGWSGASVLGVPISQSFLWVDDEILTQNVSVTGTIAGVGQQLGFGCTLGAQYSIYGWDNTDYLACEIDEIFMYNRKLTASEISFLSWTKGRMAHKEIDFKRVNL